MIGLKVNLYKSEMALIGMVEDIIKLVNIVFFKVKMFANDLSRYAIKSKSI